MQEHKKIISAFKKHDGEKADNLVRRTATIGAEVLIKNMGESDGKERPPAVLRVDV